MTRIIIAGLSGAAVIATLLTVGGAQAQDAKPLPLPGTSSAPTPTPATLPGTGARHKCERSGGKWVSGFAGFTCLPGKQPPTATTPPASKAAQSGDRYGKNKRVFGPNSNAQGGTNKTPLAAKGAASKTQGPMLGQRTNQRMTGFGGFPFHKQ